MADQKSAAPVSEEAEILTKMSVATMRGNPAACKMLNDGSGGDCPVARFMGVARGIKQTIGKDGEPTYALTGSFEGINLQNGKRYQAGILYLPGGIQEMILGPLDEALAGTAEVPADPMANITFAFDVFSYPQPNPAGYSYKASDLAAATRTDPLADLKAALSAKPLPRLAAA